MDENPRLPWRQRLCYGVGHALNDLTASMWFSYLIVYLQLVLGFDSTYAGVVLMVGQIADAIATPLLGFEASSKHGGYICKRYGKRKFMHLIGTICVLVSFPFIFSPCPGCGIVSQGALTFLLVPIVVIFQFGWAATQVSHLSLIPVITPHENERDLLNVIRNAVDIMSDISNYLVVWAVFDLTRDPGTIGDSKITAGYQGKFLLIVLVIEAIGAVFSLIFHIGVIENPVAPSPNLSATNSATESCEFEDENLSWKDWLKEFHFYQVAFLYMCTRLFQNMCIVFTPLYLQETLGANDDLIAKVPLVMNISGFVISCMLPKLFRSINKKYTLLLGSALGVGGCIWISFGEGYPYCAKGIYGVSWIMGTASSILVVCGLSFIHDLIGKSVESGAFVYGCMSFTDKLANGIAIMGIQKFHSIYCIECDWFYKDVFTYGVGAVSTTVGLACLTLMSVELGKRDRRRIKSHGKVVLKSSSSTESDFANYGSISNEDLSDYVHERTICKNKQYVF